MAAKTALAATVAMPRPPRIQPKISCAARNASRPISETLTNSPMSTNRGTEAKTYSETVPSAASAIVRVATPKSCLSMARPINPVRSSAIAIGMPSAINASTMTIIAAPTSRGSTPAVQSSTETISIKAGIISGRPREELVPGAVKLTQARRPHSIAATMEPANIRSLIGQT